MKWATASAPAAVSCYVRKSTAQVLTSGVYTTCTFDTESGNAACFDTDNIHSTVSNTGRLTVPTGLGGKWLVTFATYLGTGSPATITPKFQVNGSDFNRFPRTTYGSFENTTIFGAQVLNLVAGDYVELLIYQASGSNINADFGEYGHFGMSRLGA